jgi:hypothetical protein
MNPTQVGNLIKSLLMMAGVSTTILSYIGDEVFVALGAAAITIGIAVWQVVTSRTKDLILTVAKGPDVMEVVLHDEGLADEIPSDKVVGK